jgi:peptidoglycan/LPS O-acetylase OafA/YrhL
VQRNVDIPSLTGLRGVAALWVMMFHGAQFSATLDDKDRYISELIAGGGYLGVDVFFVLSGFILAHHYAASVRDWSFRRYGEFLMRRLARIYPVHIAALILLGALALLQVVLDIPRIYTQDLSAYGLLRSLSLTNAWSIPALSTWNVASWSVSAEWAAYLAFPMVVLVSIRLRSSAAVAAICLLLTALALSIRLSEHSSGLAFGLHRIAAEFTGGVLLYSVWKQATPLGHRIARKLSFTAVAVLIVSANLMDAHFGTRSVMAFLPILAFLVVYGFAIDRTALSAPSMQYLGKLSYSIYLVHQTFMYFARDVVSSLDRAHQPLAVMLGVLIAIILTILCAAWLFHSIEEPARRLILRHFSAPNYYKATADIVR